MLTLSKWSECRFFGYIFRHPCQYAGTCPIGPRKNVRYGFQSQCGLVISKRAPVCTCPCVLKCGLDCSSHKFIMSLCIYSTWVLLFKKLINTVTFS